MKICEYCGTSLNGDEERCPNCGAPIAGKKKATAETAELPQTQPTPPPVPEIPTEAVQGGKKESSSKIGVKFVVLLVACLLFCVAIGAVSEDGPTYDSDAVFNRNEQYLNALDNAVNSGEFTNISDFAEKGGAAYKYINNLVASRHRTVTYQSWRYLLRNSSYNESTDLIEIKSQEKFFFIYRGAGGEGYKDIFMTYYMEPQNPYRIKKIEQREDPYEDAPSAPGVVSGDNVNVRTKADTGNADNILGQAMKGERVTVYTDETKTVDGKMWFYVRHKKFGLGWMSAEYVDDPICSQ